MKDKVCRKCNGPGTVFVRKEYCYCNDCFITNTNHKFRACIGKNKKLTSNEKVLVCLSGGKSSTVLLDLIYNGINLDSHKKLRIVPFFVHITGIKKESESKKTTDMIIDQCQKYNFDLYVVNIQEYKSNEDISYCTNSFSPATLAAKNLNFTTTTGQDVLTKIKHNLFIRISKQLGCRFVLTAETTTLLAMKLLSSIVIGRGSQVENDIGFADNRDGNVEILRSMRDITNEEIDIYLNIKQMCVDPKDSDQEISLQAAIRDFVLDLQENYPSTISTVCKTADKLGSVNGKNNIKKCHVCQSTINFKDSKLTAVEATIFSRIVSSEKSPESASDLPFNTKDNTMFPYIFDRFCYCCSRNYLETKGSDLNMFLSQKIEKES
ncbi:cytoplasmic tRNA 2-thiolation protein 2 [Danaus plexippus]|uniref:cytoplasmic tRNA 2-thiolation protein 2 n=1 Tax=Danaus plexippus TaxID=13037 RepID=UPI002AB25834|nr:cytoplasmic tRNA 2-thiolation protein 2 [Danaus plexippus]